MTQPLTAAEKRVVAQLKAIAKKWPKGIWLFCNGNSMTVLRCGEHGEHVVGPGGSVDPDYRLDSINGINHDGGDW